MKHETAQDNSQKVCNCCGQKKWLHDFYVQRTGKNHRNYYSSQCKACICEEKRLKYARTRKKPDGRYLNSKGIPVEKNKYSVRLYWGERKIQEFKRVFPYDTNENLAIRFECSARTINRRAKDLGLKKDPEWLKGVWDKNRQFALFVNKLPSTRKADLTNFIEASKRTRFKPGDEYRLSLTAEQRQERSRKMWETRRKRYGVTGTRKHCRKDK